MSSFAPARSATTTALARAAATIAPHPAADRRGRRPTPRPRRCRRARGRPRSVPRTTGPRSRSGRARPRRGGARRGTTRRPARSPARGRDSRLSNTNPSALVSTSGSPPAKRSPWTSRHVHSACSSSRTGTGAAIRRWRTPTAHRPLVIATSASRTMPPVDHRQRGTPPSSSNQSRWMWPCGSIVPPDHSCVASRILRSPTTSTGSSAARPSRRPIGGSVAVTSSPW